MPKPHAAALDLKELFPFKLDEFQLEAIEHLDAGRSVLVSAPTGSGKTVVAEYAVHQALARGERVFYTTPLKALSNQKFRDLGAMLGEQRVGLLTGDISINRDADVVVMTTEVFRNMLYGTTLGAVETNLKGVRFVVLDEVHYMNDAQRGTVWEESIIYCPPPVQLVALSATVANADQMAAWMTKVHGRTDMISTDYRPVPLRFHYWDGRNLTALLRKPRPGDHKSRVDMGTRRRSGRFEQNAYPDALVVDLAEAEMLPAIYFIFSRKGCDAAMLACGHLQLLTEEEQDKVEVILDRYAQDYPSVADHPHLPYLFRGLAVHHAGMLPTWKVLVERLFQANLVKVVFATETLAAGINMPARTTILSSISKRSDQGNRILTASEFLQMSGRAGRRGMDRVGHVVVVHSPFQTLADAQRLASAPPDPLGSHFTPTYGMVLNLLQRHTLEEARFLITRSFGEFLDEQRRNRLHHRKRRKAEEQIRKLDENPDSAFATGNWRRFLGLRDVLEHYGYLEEDHPTQKGVTAAAFRAEHELLVAQAMLSGVVEGLSPSGLAAVATALIGEELRPSSFIKAQPLGRAMQAIQQLVKLARDVRIVQNRKRVDVDTRVHADCSGLSQLWAEETDWEELMSTTNLDEGDVVRVLRRTVDLLEQIYHAPMLDESIRGLARDAVRAMDREPVREIL